MQLIAEEGRGVLVYLRQEGRGIGLLDKLRAYALQDAGADTVQANLDLGLPVDTRDYGIGTQILADLGARRLRVLSNNPRKYFALSAYGLEVVEHLPLVTPPTPDNIRYLRTKRDRLGHLFDATLAVEPADAAPTPPADPGASPPATEP
jgi:3,4-dihydroxy 2-butanone 4-phosphate synthase/GTP cyclohydrolase II